MEIPAGYAPTLAAAQAYLNAYPDLKATAMQYAWALPGKAWEHFTFYGKNEGRAWDFNLTDPVTAPATATGLPDTVFGINSKVALIGSALALYFLLGKK